VPDVAQLSAPGERVQVVSKVDSRNPTEGVTGLKALGCRELTYRLIFLAVSIQPAELQAGFMNIREDSEEVRVGGCGQPDERADGAPERLQRGKPSGGPATSAAHRRPRPQSSRRNRRSSSPCLPPTRIRSTR